MAYGAIVNTLDCLVRFTMTREAAEALKRRFSEMAARGESVSYLDCVLFDAALEVLDEEKDYYAMDDYEWREALRRRDEAEAMFKNVRTIDVTGEWREVKDGMRPEDQPRSSSSPRPTCDHTGGRGESEDGASTSK